MHNSFAASSWRPTLPPMPRWDPPSAGSRLSSSPFSPHATAFGTTANMSLNASKRVHGIASDGQSLSSGASSFTSSAFDMHQATGSKDGSTATSNQASVSALPKPTSTHANDTASSEAGQYSLGDRFRNTSDHSRDSSCGAVSNLSVTSAAPSAVDCRRNQTSSWPALPTQFNKTPTLLASAPARPLLSCRPHASSEQQRGPSPSFSFHSDRHPCRYPMAPTVGRDLFRTSVFLRWSIRLDYHPAFARL